jgi:hypothetical protein
MIYYGPCLAFSGSVWVMNFVHTSHDKKTKPITKPTIFLYYYHTGILSYMEANTDIFLLQIMMDKMKNYVIILGQYS